MWRKRLVLLILAVVALTGTLAFTYYHVVHIEIKSSGKTKIWKEKYKGTSCQLKELEEMERKLFGNENPTMLDAAKIVIEKEGEKVGEFIDHYGKICFYAIAYNLRNCSVDICILCSVTVTTISLLKLMMNSKGNITTGTLRMRSLNC